MIRLFFASRRNESFLDLPLFSRLGLESGQSFLDISLFGPYPVTSHHSGRPYGVVVFNP